MTKVRYHNLYADGNIGIGWNNNLACRRAGSNPCPDRGRKVAIIKVTPKEPRL